MNKSQKRLLEEASDRLADLEEKGRGIKRDLRCILQELSEQTTPGSQRRLLETNIEQLGRLAEETRTARKDIECVLQEVPDVKQPKKTRKADRLNIGYKTMMCKLWLRSACKLPDDECPFAHGSEDLILYKGIICTRWCNGVCFSDSRLCGFSHDCDEYVEPDKPSTPITQVDRTAADRLLRGLLSK